MTIVVIGTLRVNCIFIKKSIFTFSHNLKGRKRFNIKSKWPLFVNNSKSEIDISTFDFDPFYFERDPFDYLFDRKGSTNVYHVQKLLFFNIMKIIFKFKLAKISKAYKYKI